MREELLVSKMSGIMVKRIRGKDGRDRQQTGGWAVDRQMDGRTDGRTAKCTAQHITGMEFVTKLRMNE